MTRYQIRFETGKFKTSKFLRVRIRNCTIIKMTRYQTKFETGKPSLKPACMAKPTDKNVILYYTNLHIYNNLKSESDLRFCISLDSDFCNNRILIKSKLSQDFEIKYQSPFIRTRFQFFSNVLRTFLANNEIFRDFVSHILSDFFQNPSRFWTKSESQKMENLTKDWFILKIFNPKVRKSSLTHQSDSSSHQSDSSSYHSDSSSYQSDSSSHLS